MAKPKIGRENQAAISTGKIAPLCEYINARLKETHRPVQFTVEELAQVFQQSSLSETTVERLIASYTQYHVVREDLPVDARNLNSKKDEGQRAVINITRLTFWKRAEFITG